MQKIIVLNIIFILFPTLTFTQNSQWITIEHTSEVSPRISIDQAKNELLLLAREQAVAKVTGYRIEETVFMLETQIDGETSQWHESYNRIFREHVNGKITQEKKPEFDIKTTDDGIFLSIVYEAEVTPEEGSPDPGFVVDFKVDRTVYQVGDPIVMEAKVSQDAYITIFSLLADGTAAVIFPNRYMPDNKLSAGKKRIIPNNTEREILSFVALDRDDENPPFSEVLLCIATKKPYRFQSVNDALEYSTHFTEINNWIINIDIDKRVEAMANYSIVRQ